MSTFLANPYWLGLATEQSSIALGGSRARRFPADVVPFAGVREATPDAMRALYELLTPGEPIYVTGVSDAAGRADASLPAHPAIALRGSFPGWQMRHAGPIADASAAQVRIETLSGANADEMVALTNVAFPGYFRARTYTLGTYLGLRAPNGQLIAMGGERLALPGVREISAVCTHPEHRGHGYAAMLIAALLRLHRDAGLGSLLHVTASNTNAIALYERLGFSRSGKVVWNHLERLSRE